MNLPSHRARPGILGPQLPDPSSSSTVTIVEFKKGPFYPEVGDFSGAGAANVRLVNKLPAEGILNVQGGMFGYGRARSSPILPRVGPGQPALRLRVRPLRRGRGSSPSARTATTAFCATTGTTRAQKSTLTASVYLAPEWRSTDCRSPSARSTRGSSRASGGALDPSDGGNTGRGALTLGLDAPRRRRGRDDEGDPLRLFITV